MFDLKFQKKIISGIAPNPSSINKENEQQTQSEIEHKTKMSYVDKRFAYGISMMDLNEFSKSFEAHTCSHECSECSDTSSLNSNDDYEDSQQNHSIDFLSAKEINHDDATELCPIYLNEIEIDHSEEEQTITELVHASNQKELLTKSQNNRMRVVFGIILRLVLPLANGVARSIKGIQDVRFLRAIKSIVSSRQTLTNVIAFAANTISMSLSSVQVTHRIEPVLKLLKIHKSSDGLESLPDSSGNGVKDLSTKQNLSIKYSPLLRAPTELLLNYSPSKRKTFEQPAHKCCTLNILAQPPPGTPIRADIVFIHGLHGSLVNTWKQGLWENERKPVEFERPPKPPVRPPKRPPHSRSTALHAPHKQKRARYAQNSEESQPAQQSFDQSEHDAVGDNGFSYVCGEPKDIQICDEIEYSFPTFRLRMNDNGRQLRSELETKPSDKKLKQQRSNSSDDSNYTNNSKMPTNANITASDPNYSKCWPGDWLPIDCPGVRVIALNYTTDQYLWRPLWKKKESRSSLVQRSREMAELLIAHKVGYGHPIIWVGHSKGGLFVKQIIVDAWESGRPAAAPFWRSARGVFFYSVPHRGSHLASIKAPFLTRSVELIDIEKNSKYLSDLHRRFLGLYHLGHLKIEVFSFVETALTLMSVLYLRIVGVDSADPGIGDVCGIHLDHREICKPRSRECILYKELVKMINKVC